MHTVPSQRPALRVPGDKSIAHRALLLAALAEGTSRLRGVPTGLDVGSTQSALRAVGVTIAEVDGGLVVDGCAGLFAAPAAPIDCGNSGTTLRLLCGLLATRGVSATLTGDASLRARPMRRIAEPLAAFGADVQLSEHGTAPVQVRGNPDARGAAVAVRVASAQVKSAILLAALGAHGHSRITGALATRDHTERLLPAFGVPLERAAEGALVVHGPARLVATAVDVPGDISSAAFLLAAAAAAPGARVQIEDVGLNPTRTAFLGVLRRFGADIEAEVTSAEDIEPRGRIAVRGAALHAVTIGPDEVPALIDELPLIGVLGAFACGTTTVRGAAELRVKESDRIAAFADAARALGIEVETFDDGFAVRGLARFRPAHVATHGDHRIAMAFAAAGRAAGVRVELDDPACAAVSFPDFYDVLERVT